MSGALDRTIIDDALDADSDYLKYRGKCKQMCEVLLAERPELTLVRGFYHCPYWGEQQHWWLKDPEGNIVDPTVKQFPTKGAGAVYVEFNGTCECKECGNSFKEEDGKFESNYSFCSNKCLMHFVGL